MNNDEQRIIISLLKEIINSLNNIDKTQKEMLRLFKKYDDEYVSEIAKEGFIEKP